MIEPQHQDDGLNTLQCMTSRLVVNRVEAVLKQGAKARNISLARFWASSIFVVSWGEAGSVRYLQPSPDPHTAFTSALTQDS
jgi:hypothetical protein